MAALSAHLRRPLTLIAESDLNDALTGHRRARRAGSASTPSGATTSTTPLHVALTGETSGYYADFEPLSALAKVCERGFFHDGTFSSFRGRDHGAPGRPATMPTWRLVVCNQNHDQVGNRAAGDRLTEHLDEDQLRRARRCSPWPGRSRRCCSRARSGRRRRRSSSSPPTPSPSSATATAEGRLRGVRADGLGPRARARPAGPRDLPALEARLVGARARIARAGARGVPAPRRAAPLAARS